MTEPADDPLPPLPKPDEKTRRGLAFSGFAMEAYAREAQRLSLARWHLIGYSCDEGGCGRIHEDQVNDYMTPVYVRRPVEGT